MQGIIMIHSASTGQGVCVLFQTPGGRTRPKRVNTRRRVYHLLLETTHLRMTMVLGGARTWQAVPQQEGVQLLLGPPQPSYTPNNLIRRLLLLVPLVLGALQEPQPGGVDQVGQLVKVKGQGVVVPEQDDAVAGLGILEQVGACTHSRHTCTCL
jgi:hypothetical protein